MHCLGRADDPSPRRKRLDPTRLEDPRVCRAEGLDLFGVADAEGVATSHTRIDVICAKLLAVGHLRLNLLVPVEPHLLLLRHAALNLLLPVHALVLRLTVSVHCALLRHAGLSLLAVHTLVLRLLTIRADLLACRNSRVGLLAIGMALRDPLRTSLLPLGAHLRPLRTGLLTLGAHLHALRTLRPLNGGKALLALHTRRGKGLPLLARSGKSTAAATAALNGLSPLAPATSAASCDLRVLAVVTAPVAARPGGRRDRDRQCGDSRGEKYPGHDTISFRTAKRPARYTVPTLKRMEPAL